MTSGITEKPTTTTSSSTTQNQIAKGSPESLQTLFTLHRSIEKQYQLFSWPPQLQNIAVVTEVAAGRGDISAAAKVIRLMQKMEPSLRFEWIVLTNKYDLPSFLEGSDLTKITIRNLDSLYEEPILADFLVGGPVKPNMSTEEIQSKFKISLKGTRFNFLENASAPKTEEIVAAACSEMQLHEDLDALYRKVHKILFGSLEQFSSGVIMGLQQGSGVFFDESRLNASLSLGYCCPSYLLQLEDTELKRDLCAALCVEKSGDMPDYNQHSFNSGYAHRPVSWAKFIDFVAIHETVKNVTIVLNQHGEFDKLNTEQFAEQIFTEARLEFLQTQGYTAVTIKGQEEKPIYFQMTTMLKRQLTIVVRPSFKPSDMKYLQLASERLLATGDNTAAEAWAAKCKLYVYEDVANKGCKGDFLKQQVEVAKTISQDLGTLLHLFGKNNVPLSSEEMEQAVSILQNSSLAEETLQFCQQITQQYSFAPVLEGALKRAAWQQCIPKLIEEEADAMDRTWKEGLIQFLWNTSLSLREIAPIENLTLISQRAQQLIQIKQII